jgi:hypothetical protein
VAPAQGLVAGRQPGGAARRQLVRRRAARRQLPRTGGAARQRGAAEEKRGEADTWDPEEKTKKNKVPSLTKPKYIFLLAKIHSKNNF